MKELFYIDTENKMGQVLVFDDYMDAFMWCKSATRWSVDEIHKKIKSSINTDKPFASLFIRRG